MESQKNKWFNFSNNKRPFSFLAGADNDPYADERWSFR